MRIRIEQSQAKGKVTAPPSKSMAHRQLIAAALGAEPRAVDNLDWSEDVLATLDCLRALGASVSRKERGVVLGGLDPFAVEEGTVLPCRADEVIGYVPEHFSAQLLYWLFHRKSRFVLKLTDYLYRLIRICN